jgi:hypothetical protein
VSPLCARQSEPSEADSLYASDITLSRLPLDCKVQHTFQRAKESIGRPNHTLKLQLPLTQTQPLIAHPSSKYTYHDDTTSALQHTSFYRCITAVHTTTNPDFQHRVPSIVWPNPATASKWGGAEQTSYLFLSARAKATTTQ